MVVIDTHILIWWVNGSAELSDVARQRIAAELDGQGEILISSITIWEIAMLMNKGRLVFTMDLQSWISEVEQIEGVRFIPVDNQLALKSTSLPDHFHKDPADRMIVATARKFAVPLITADEIIRNYKYVETIF